MTYDNYSKVSTFTENLLYFRILSISIEESKEALLHNF